MRLSPERFSRRSSGYRRPSGPPTAARAIQGKGAFRQFKDELHEVHPDLLPAWHAFRDTRARRRAVQWLADNSLIDDASAARFVSGHPDSALP